MDWDLPKQNDPDKNSGSGFGTSVNTVCRPALSTGLKIPFPGSRSVPIPDDSSQKILAAREFSPSDFWADGTAYFMTKRE